MLYFKLLLVLIHVKCIIFILQEQLNIVRYLIQSVGLVPPLPVLYYQVIYIST